MLNDQATRCTATTRDGSRCKNPAVTGSNVCRMHGAGGGAPAGNKNAVTHGGYAIPHHPEAIRQRYMMQRQNQLDAALEEAAKAGDARRFYRIVDLLVKNELLMLRSTGRFRRSLTS